MTNEKVLIIVLVVFILLGVLGLVFFNTLFLLKRHYMNVDYKLKNKYNYYYNTSIGSNIKSIETIVAKNQNLLPILMYLKDYNNQYEKQLEIVKIQLRSLSSLLKTYKLVKIHNKIKQIKDNFDALDKQQEEYKRFNLDTQKYSDNVSLTATNLFNILSMISQFNKENMTKIIYKHITNFKTINDEINEISSQINDEINCINSESIHRLFLQELNQIKQLYSLSKDIYEVDKYRLSLEVLCSQITETINKYEASTDVKVNLFKKTKNSEELSKELIRKMSTSDLKNIKQIYIEELNKLEKILQEVKVDNLYSKIYHEQFDAFKDNLSAFYKVISENDIKSLYQDILKNFKNDKQLVDLIFSNIELINTINSEIDSFNKNLNKPKSTPDLEASVQHIYNIYEFIITFKNDNNQLFNLIKQKNKALSEITFSINDCTIKLLDIERLMNKNKVNNSELINQIKIHNQTINEIKEQLSSGRSLNHQEINGKISSINSFLNSSMDSIKTNHEILEIVKHLKMYANRYKTNSNKEQFKTFDKLFNEGNYYDLIESYITFIQKNKKQKKVS